MVLGAFAFGATMLLMAGALSIVYFHTHPRCSDQVLSELSSPDRRWTAAVMQRRCGDEAPFLVHVNLRPVGGPLSLGYFSGRADDGEVFVAEQENLDTFPTLRWDSASQLSIGCPDCRPSRVQKRQERWGPVTVRYEMPAR